MEPDRRLTAQGMERKQQLLDRAAELFAERGYAETRVIDIVRAAGVAKGLFYWYFENKEALFAELVRAMRADLQRERAAAIDPAADPLTRLRQAVESSVRFIVLHTEFFTVLRMERREPTVSALLREASDADIAGVAHLVADCQQAGLIPSTDSPAFLAQGVVGAVFTFCHAHRTGRLGMDVDEVACAAGRWVVRALGSRQDSPDVAAAGDDESDVRRLPTGRRQPVRVAHASQPIAPTGISAR